MNNSSTRWDRAKLAALSLEYESLEIRQIKVGRTVKDRLIWNHNSKGVYSINAGYYLLKEKAYGSKNWPSSSTTLQGGNINWMSVCDLQVLLKIKHFI